jgi:hypothetical protein
MKTHRILCLCAAIVMPQLANAELPFPNDVFAKFEGTLDFCAQVNSKAAQTYEKGKKLLLQGATEKDASEARKTQEYKDAYESAKNELGKLPKNKALEVCTASLEDIK